MKIDLDRVPANLDDAIQIIYDGLTPQDIADIKEFDSGASHFGFGMYLRNNWSLWVRDTVLVRWFAENYKIVHADDISGIVLSGVWAKVRGDAFEPQKIAESFHAHWERMGYDPMKEQI
jgi:hypothetical protein